jgi:hypothetical protein
MIEFEELSTYPADARSVGPFQPVNKRLYESSVLPASLEFGRSVTARADGSKPQWRQRTRSGPRAARPAPRSIRSDVRARWVP